MKNKDVDIIRLLLENKDKDLSINQVAKLLNKDYKNTHNIVSRLSRMQVVDLQPFGNSYRVNLVCKAHPLVFEAEYGRRADILRDRNLAVMSDSFRGLNSKLYILLLFGSYAKRTQTKKSDIDLLFVVPDCSSDEMERAITNTTGILPLNIHVNIFKESEFAAMIASKKTTVASEAVANNVILHGIEPFYEMIS